MAKEGQRHFKLISYQILPTWIKLRYCRQNNFFSKGFQLWPKTPVKNPKFPRFKSAAKAHIQSRCKRFGGWACWPKCAEQALAMAKASSGKNLASKLYPVGCQLCWQCRNTIFTAPHNPQVLANWGAIRARRKQHDGNNTSSEQIWSKILIIGWSFHESSTPETFSLTHIHQWISQHSIQYILGFLFQCQLFRQKSSSSHHPSSSIPTSLSRAKDLH